MNPANSAINRLADFQRVCQIFHLACFQGVSQILHVAILPVDFLSQWKQPEACGWILTSLYIHSVSINICLSNRARNVVTNPPNPIGAKRNSFLPLDMCQHEGKP